MNNKTAIITDLIEEMHQSQLSLDKLEKTLPRPLHHHPADKQNASYVEFGFGMGLSRAFFLIACYLNDHTVINNKLINELVENDKSMPTGWTVFDQLREHRRDDGTKEAWDFETVGDPIGDTSQQLELLPRAQQH